MTREAMTRTLGWKNLAVAGFLLVTILAGALAARQRAIEGVRAAARGVTPTASQSEVLRSGSWLRTIADERGGPVVDVQLDRVLDELGLGVALDRPALVSILQAVVGPDPQIEDKRVGDVFGRVSRIRINSQGMSVLIGRRVVMQTLQHLTQARGPVEQMTVGEVLDALAGARLSLDGLSGLLDQDGVVALLGNALPAGERSGPGRDPMFLRRLALRRQYAAVVELVRQLRRGDFIDADRNVLYAEAHRQLVAAGKLSSVPLLDGHLRLEEELAAAKVGTSSRAERIASRWEARRRAFGPEMADMLFSRDEAMERYEVDRLGLEADPSLSAEEKAARLEARRQALKVELAAQGTFVSFPDGAAPAGSPDAGEGRPR
jgi:lipase chaperone protein